MSFNPLAGNFSSVAWIAPEAEYELKILEWTYTMVGNETPKPVLTCKIAIASGEFANKRPQAIQIWEPETDFAQAARIIVAALGYHPGKDDARFVEERGGDLDLSLDSSDSQNMVMGSGYAETVGSVFKADLGKTTSKKNGQTYQSYKMIRPLND